MSIQIHISEYKPNRLSIYCILVFQFQNLFKYLLNIYKIKLRNFSTFIERKIHLFSMYENISVVLPQKFHVLWI